MNYKKLINLFLLIFVAITCIAIPPSKHDYKSIPIIIRGVVLCGEIPEKKVEVAFFDGHPTRKTSKKIHEFKTDKNGMFEERVDIPKGKPYYLAINIQERYKPIIEEKYFSTESNLDFGQIDVCKNEEKPKIKTLNIRTYNYPLVSIREKPESNSKVISRVKSGETFEILEKSDMKDKISWEESPNKIIIARDYWYKVKNDEIDEGWIIGTYTNRAIDYEEKELNIKLKRKIDVFVFAGEKNTIIGSIKKGEVCNVTDMKNESGSKWYKVKHSLNGITIIGWVKGSDNNVYRM